MKKGVLVHEEDDDSDGESDPTTREDDAVALSKKNPVEQIPAVEDNDKQPHASDVVARVALATVAVCCFAFSEESGF